MCGQVGLLLGSAKRSPAELSHLVGLFIQVLKLSEERGPYATGVAWIDRDGEHRICKQPMPASEFIQDQAFLELIGDIGSGVSLVMGHTRWPTRGSIQNIANSQPIRAGRIVATHNGTITNADSLFRFFLLPRHAQVDSEVIFRLADDTIGPDGSLDTRCLAERIALCRGTLAFVMIAKTDPERIVLAKSGKPLELIYHKRHKVIFYASCMNYIRHVFGNGADWIRLMVPHNTLMTIHTQSLAVEETIPISRGGRKVSC